jgi:hypothetical protein
MPAMPSKRTLNRRTFADAGATLHIIQASKREPRMMRYELTDYEWAAIRPMLPNKARGVRRVDD